MTPSDIRAIRQLLSDFAWFADRGDGSSLAALFLVDGVLVVGGREFSGATSIAQDCTERAARPNRKTRHLWTNLRVERASAEEVVTTAVQLTFEQLGPQEPTQLRVNDIFDTFARSPAGDWRFARRVINREIALTV
jgi:uncharacterized protein (TIGR02246 family)